MRLGVTVMSLGLALQCGELALGSWPSPQQPGPDRSDLQEELEATRRELAEIWGDLGNPHSGLDTLTRLALQRRAEDLRERRDEIFWYLKRTRTEPEIDFLHEPGGGKSAAEHQP